MVTTETVSDFSSSLINPEWGTAPFSFQVGSVLAVEQPQQIYIDRDLFRPITSIFVLVSNSNIQNNEWHVSIDNEKVRISVSPNLKRVMDRVRNSDQNRAILINSIYFGAVMQCIKSLKSSNEFDDYRWAQVLRQQASQLNIDIENDEEYLIAQKMLRLPLGLLNTYVFRGDGDEGDSE